MPKVYIYPKRVECIPINSLTLQKVTKSFIFYQKDLSQKKKKKKKKNRHRCSTLPVG